MVTQVEADEKGEVTGVVFKHDGKEYRQKARDVFLSNFVVETPPAFAEYEPAFSRWAGKHQRHGWQSDHAPQQPRHVRLIR